MGGPCESAQIFLDKTVCIWYIDWEEKKLAIPLDKLTIHTDDLRQVGWFDTLTGEPKRGSVPLLVIDTNAVEQRENADLVARIARQRDYEAKNCPTPATA